MASSTLTRNLKLRISSNLTADAKYNLERIDLLGSTFLVDTTDSLNVRSKTDINIEPESPDLDGSGVGGVVNVGNTSHELGAVNIYSTLVNLSDRLGLFDAAVGGTKYLRIGYNSTLSGTVDTGSDRALVVDLDGADRQLILGGSFSLFSGDLVLTSQNASSSYNLPAGAAGTLATIANVEAFTNKTINADLNTITNIRNANVASNAGIDYSKLNLALSIVNSDVAVGAGIVYTKLSLANSIINNDINSAAGIQYSKLNLTNGIINSDIATNAAIGYAKLNLTNSIQGSDLNSGIVIAGTNVNPDFGTQNIVTTGTIGFRNASSKITSFQADPSQLVNIPFTLPSVLPAGNQVLRANAATPTLLEWASVSGTGTVTSVDMSVPTNEFSISGNPITSAGTLALTLQTQLANSVWAGPTSGGATQPAFRALVVADLPAGSVVGITDTASVDLTLTGSNLSATVLPAGVDHNSLANYVASRHIDHAAVAINTAGNSGLGGGGDIQLTRNLVVDPLNAPTKASPGAADSVLISDAAASGALKSATLGSIITAVAGGSFVENWTSGTTHTTTHSLGSRDVTVEVYDNTTFETIFVDQVIRTNTNTVDFTASSAPTGSGWRILIKKVA